MEPTPEIADSPPWAALVGRRYARPVPPPLRRLVQATGALALLLVFGTILIFTIDEAWARQLIAAVPFAADSEPAFVVGPVLAAVLILWGIGAVAVASRHNEVLVHDGAIRFRPLWTTELRPHAPATILTWNAIERVEDVAEGLRLESGPLRILVPTEDPEDFARFAALAEAEHPAPQFELRRGVWKPFLHGMFLLGVSFGAFVCTLYGVGRFTPTLFAGVVDPRLLLLPILCPALVWYVRNRIPPLPANSAWLVTIVPGGLILDGTAWIPFAETRLSLCGTNLILRADEAEQQEPPEQVLALGEQSTGFLHALPPGVAVAYDAPPPDSQWRRRVAYAGALGLLALQWLLFVAL